MGAMVDAVGRHGYQATTLRELVALAGVSYATFYEQFKNKQDCFLATFDEIIAQANQRVLRASGSSGPEAGVRERLQAAFEAYVDIIIEEPKATYLVVVESLSLGAAGVDHRRRSSQGFELMIQQALEGAPELGEISELTIRAIVGGIGRVVYRCIRSDQGAQLRDHINDLLDWGLSYPRPSGARVLPPASGEPVTPAAKAGERPDDVEVWDENPDSIRRRSALTQRDRMIRAAAMVVAGNGYAKLSIPAITSAAGVSNQTFYAHFTSKEEVFLEALDVLGRRLMARVIAAIEARASIDGGVDATQAWANKVGAVLEALLAYLAEKPLLARLPFIEALGAGWAALDRVDLVVDSISAMLEPATLPPALDQPLSAVVSEAISGGIYAVVQHEIAQERTAGLPQLLPEVAFIALAPSAVV